MENLCIQTEQDVRQARSIYRKLREYTSAMVFLYDPSHCQYLVFGPNALWLEDIINEIDVSTIYKLSTLDKQQYYKIPRSRLPYLLNELVERHIEIRII